MIIGLGHRANVGKDTLAKMLRKHLSPSVSVSFADKVKEAVFLIYRGWTSMETPEYYITHPADKDAVIPEIGKSFRDCCICLGNSMRSVHDETWIRAALRGDSPDCWIIVTDVRYQNEAEYIKEQGGLCVRIDRAAAPLRTDVSDTALAEWHGWDAIINNDLSLADMEASIQTHTVPWIKKWFHGS